MAGPEPTLHPALADSGSHLRRGIKRLWLACCLLALALIVVAGGSFFMLRRLSRSITNARFDVFTDEVSASTDYITPDVNVIQFLRHGYSITLDSVQYRPGGLYLSGQIGNATEMALSSLALSFSARPYAYAIEDKWEKEGIPFWNSSWDIGEAQTEVGSLPPGSTAPFTVTIPNVKQTSSGIQIAVSFSGERYQYTK